MTAKRVKKAKRENTTYYVKLSVVVTLDGPRKFHDPRSVWENVIERLQAGDHDDMETVEILRSARGRRLLLTAANESEWEQK